MNNTIYAGVMISLMLLGCAGNDVVSNANPKIRAIDCQPEQRAVDGCIEIYQPVCGQIICEDGACPETFENSCKACADARVISYLEGACSEQGGVKI